MPECDGEEDAETEGVWLTDEDDERLASDAVALSDTRLVGSVCEAEAETLTLNVALDVGGIDGSDCVVEGEALGLTLEVRQTVDVTEAALDEVELGHRVAP